MDFETLIDEVQARGYDYLSDERVGRYLNQSLFELCALMPWPFLETNATGTTAAGVAITDVRHILSVTDTTNKRSLAPVDQRNLRRIDPDLSEVGDACAWYLLDTTVKTWPTPASAAALRVEYVKAPAELVATSDEPVVPEEWQDIIVDGAVCKAAKDNDGYGALQQIRAEWQRQVDVMVQALMNRALDRPMHVFMSEPKNY